MLRLTPVLVALLALAVLVPCVAAPPAAAAPHDVRVQVVCRPQDGEGPKSVTVAPWLLWVEPGDTVTWHLNITGSNNNWIEIAAKEGQPWLFVKKKQRGEDKTVQFEGMEEDLTHEYDYNYNITVSCNAYEFVIDPRVRVR